MIPKCAPLAAAAFALLAHPAVAALSGYYDSIEQIQAILADDAVAKALPPYPLSALEFLGTTAEGQPEWRITGDGCRLQVTLQPVPPGTSADGMPVLGKTTYQVAKIGGCN